MNEGQTGEILAMQSLGTMTVKLDDNQPLPPGAQFTLGVPIYEGDMEFFDVEVLRQNAHKIYSVRIIY